MLREIGCNIWVQEQSLKYWGLVEKILSWDFQRVVMAHGSIVENNAKKQLKNGYEWFLNQNLTCDEVLQ